MSELESRNTDYIENDATLETSKIPEKERNIYDDKDVASTTELGQNELVCSSETELAAGIDDLDVISEEEKTCKKTKRVKFIKKTLVCIGLIVAVLLTTFGIKAYLNSINVEYLLEIGKYDKAITIVNQKVAKNSKNIDKYNSIILEHLNHIYENLNTADCTNSETFKRAEEKNEKIKEMNLGNDVKAKQEELTKLIDSRKAYYQAYKSSSFDEVQTSLDKVIKEDTNYQNAQYIKTAFIEIKKIETAINKANDDYSNSHIYYAETMNYYDKFKAAWNNIKSGTIPPNFLFDDFISEVEDAVFDGVKYSFYSMQWDEDSSYIINVFLKDYSALAEFSAWGIDLGAGSGAILDKSNVFNPVIRKANNNIELYYMFSTEINEDDISYMRIFSDSESIDLLKRSSETDVSPEELLQKTNWTENVIHWLKDNKGVNIEITYFDGAKEQYIFDDLFKEAFLKTYALDKLIKYDSNYFEQIKLYDMNL